MGVSNERVERKRGLKWYETSIPLRWNHCAHPLLCLRQTFPHFLHFLLFLSVNKQLKNHTTAYNFHYTLFPSYCGLLWLKYYSSWKQQRKMSWSLRQVLVQRDGIEPRALFPGSKADASLFRGNSAQRTPKNRSKRSRSYSMWDVVSPAPPWAGPLKMEKKKKKEKRKSLREHLGTHSCGNGHFRALNHTKIYSPI